MGKFLSYEEVKSRIESKGVKLISDTYNGETSKIIVRCGCGVEIETTYASVRNAGKSGIYRCRECAKEYSREYFRMPFKDIQNYFKDNGCELISEEGEYVNIFSEFKYIARCGHVYKTSFQSFKNSKLKMCAECLKKIHCGENSYNWKGGYDSEKVKFRKTYEFKKWVKDVYKRDNYTCQCCGEYSGGNLNAHHINGYNWDVENRTNIDNGVTLCKKCHEKFHDEYGKGNNTKEQYEEWIEEGKGKTITYDIKVK